MTNYEKAVKIAKLGYRLEDALELLNSGMSFEETVKVLEKKKKKLEKDKQREFDEELGGLMIEQMLSGWIARRDKRREWRKRCVDRWGNLADEIKKGALLTQMTWYCVIPMLISMSMLDLVKMPVVYIPFAFAAINVVRMVKFCGGPDTNEHIQGLLMTKTMFRWWVNRAGSRNFVRHVGEVIDKEQLVSIVGEKKAAKLIDKREAVQIKYTEQKQQDEEIKARRMQLARQYCPDNAEGLYTEATYHDGSWMLIVYFALYCAAIPISMVLCRFMPATITIMLMIGAVWAVISAVMAYGIFWFIDRVFWDYERSLRRIVRKRAIARVMGDEKESSKAEQENCSG